jgi:hypothetical protein
MCEEKKDLKERLGTIMKSKKHTRAAIVASAAVVLAAVLAACALGAGVSGGERIYIRSDEEILAGTVKALGSSDYAEITVKFAETQGPGKIFVYLRQNDENIGGAELAIGEGVTYAVSGYSGTEVFAKSIDSNGNVKFEITQTRSTAESPAPTDTATVLSFANYEYGFGFIFPAAWADKVAVDQIDGYYPTFGISAPDIGEYGVGTIARLVIYPQATDWEKISREADEGYTYLGGSDLNTFVLFLASDVSVAANDTSAQELFITMRDDLEAYNYSFALIDTNRRFAIESPAPPYDPDFVFENKFEVSPDPDIYTPTMSSVPGILLSVSGQASGRATMMYECDSGSFLYLENGKITPYGNEAEVYFGSLNLHWTPDSNTRDGDRIVMRLIDDGGGAMAAQGLKVRVNGFYYSLENDSADGITPREAE